MTTTAAAESQDFDSILASLPTPTVGELQKAKCREFAKKVTHNGTKAEREKIVAALSSWLKFIKDKLTDEAKAQFKAAVEQMLAMMAGDAAESKISVDTYLANQEKKLIDPTAAKEYQKQWLSCWSDMFSACDRNNDNRLVQEEAETLLLAFNVPQEFSEALFDLLCDEFEETLDRRTYVSSMNEYFFTDARTGIFGELFSDKVSSAS